MPMANAPTPGQRWMANSLPLGHRKLENPPLYPGGDPRRFTWYFHYINWTKIRTYIYIYIQLKSQFSSNKKILSQSLLIFGQRCVGNRVTIATAWVPGDQKVHKMMCNRLTIKVTKFQQSTTNRFWTVAKHCLGVLGEDKIFPPPYKIRLRLYRRVKQSIAESL